MPKIPPITMASAAISDPAAAVGVDLIPIDSPGIQEFVDSQPYYVMTSVPAGTYTGVDYPVTTFAVKATVVTSADTGDDVVYGFVKSLFENIERLRESHPAFMHLGPEGMLEGMSAPLHAGAARYFREVGLLARAQ